MRDCRALNFVHSWDNALTSTSDVLRRHCHLRQERSGDAGQFKKVDNDVIEARLGTPSAHPVRFCHGHACCDGGMLIDRSPSAVLPACRLARTIQAPMNGTGAASLFDPATQRRSGSMDPDGGIFWRDA